MNRQPKRISVGIILSWLLITLATHAGDLRVTRMTCDYRVNPLGVDAAKPQLSWRLESGERGQQQTAYQVLVASSAKLLAKGDGDVWDSGKMASEENIGVLYGGKLLATRQQVFWEVRVWDAAGKPSAWSSPATWTMGVLAPDAWNAKWISSPTNQYVAGPAVYLQKQIAVPKKVRRATARYSALGWVELTIDGRKVGDAVLSPEFSDLNRRVLYVTHDVTSLLSKGGHTFEAVYLTDVPAYYRNWWRDFAANQTPDGYLGAIAPIAGLQTHGWNCPWWSGMIVYLPWKFYEYYGDRQMLAEAYEPMKLYVDFLGRRARKGVGANTGALRGRPTDKVDETAIRDGLLAWGTGDWQGLVKPPVALTSTAAWAYYAGIVSRTAAILGRENEAREYAKLSDEITQRFNKKFFDSATGLYAKSKNSQSAYVVPLSLGLVPEEDRPLAIARLVDAVRGATNHLNTGFVGTPFLLQCLTDVGHADLAAEIVNQRDFPGWGTLTNEGVFKENWRGEHAMMPSLGGPVGAWFYQSILGIRPDPAGPGFKRIIIKPEIVGGLTWAKGSYDSVRGKISSAWEKRGERFSLRVEIPANTTATVYLPVDSANSIREGGRNLTGISGVQLLRREAGFAVLRVESGRYEFESRLK